MVRIGAQRMLVYWSSLSWINWSRNRLKPREASCSKSPKRLQERDRKQLPHISNEEEVESTSPPDPRTRRAKTDTMLDN